MPQIVPNKKQIGKSFAEIGCLVHQQFLKNQNNTCEFTRKVVVEHPNCIIKTSTNKNTFCTLTFLEKP